MKIPTKEIAVIALFTAVMVIFSQIAVPIPISPVPITLSIFAVFLISTLLGHKSATVVQVVYLLLGIIGAPVFNGFTGGIGKVFGPTGGYIMSYIPMSYVMGLLVFKYSMTKYFQMVFAMLIGLVICYSLGTAWLMASTGMNFTKAVYAAVLPFAPLDIIKIFAAAGLSHSIRKRLVIA
ncbi:MAG: biotin transporter BioY [Firmicutes bacterium]|nr:biotin transporter BioY [Bacillota bacterium]